MLPCCCCWAACPPLLTAAPAALHLLTPSPLPPPPPHPHTLLSYAERAYKAVPPMADDDVVYHFRQMAKTMHRQSDEFAAQEARNREFVDMVNEKRRLRQVAAQEEGKTLSPTELEEDDTQRNQFNFTERAAQTYNPTTKVRTISTTPPDSTNNSGAMTQWGLYDAYMLEFERLTSLANMEKNVKDAKARARAEAGSGGAQSAEDGSKSGGDPMHAPEMAARMRIMERIVNQVRRGRGRGAVGQQCSFPSLPVSLRHALSHTHTHSPPTPQNAEDEIYSDFKYWEDESDLAGLDDKGRLLPLWRFEDSRTRRKMVTALAWNVGFSDLFAVGYGSYDFMRQGSGLICVFTLKNVACPEYLFTAESGVMSLDFSDSAHPLLAVGCYDGSVRVYDVRKRENKPIFSSDGQKFKHSDPVWEVKWARAAPGAPQPAEPCFYSASSDGIMARWTVTKSELQYEPVLALKVLAAPPGDVPGGAIVAAAAAGGSSGAAAASSSSAAAATAGAGALAASGQLVGGGSSSSSSSGGDLAATSASAVGSGIAAVAALRGEGAGSSSSSSSSSSSDGSGSGSAEAGSAPKVVGLAGCCCFAFSPLFPTEYLVGTEEGRIHKGSLETPGSVSATFGGGHGMAVYALRWNPWHPRVFLSCSADWTVRMWDDSHTSGPIARFDLNCAVSDCAWAPYSSTVFAATTEDQKVAVWDLAVNKKEPLCIQKVSVWGGGACVCASVLSPSVALQQLSLTHTHTHTHHYPPPCRPSLARRTGARTLPSMLQRQSSWWGTSRAA